MRIGEYIIESKNILEIMGGLIVTCMLLISLQHTLDYYKENPGKDINGNIKDLTWLDDKTDIRYIMVQITYPFIMGEYFIWALNLRNIKRIKRKKKKGVVKA